jgi:hypothetical protein
LSQRLKPLNQGDLDGLCGLYSIVNAVDHVLRIGDAEHNRLLSDLFSNLCKSLGKKLPVVITEGLTTKELSELLEVATKWAVRKKVGFLNVEMPYKKAGPIAPRTLVRDLGDMLESAEGAMITGVLAPPSPYHWTVITAASDEQLTLHDSGGFEKVLTPTITPDLPERGQVYVDPPSMFFLCRVHK